MLAANHRVVDFSHQGAAGYIRRMIFLRMLAVFAALGAAAQAQSSWESLRTLAVGDRVVVRDAAGEDHKGSFRAVTNQTVTIMAGKSEVSLERARVKRVQVSRGSRRLRHALIGAGIGAAVGAIADGTLGAYIRNEQGDIGGVRAATYLAPIGLFAAIGAALPSYKTIYRVK